MVAHWSLSYSKSTKVFKTFLSILADINYTVVWMDSTHPLITNPLVTVPSVASKQLSPSLLYPQNFSFLWQNLSSCLFFLFFGFTLGSAGTTKSTTWSGRLTEIRWSVSISKSQIVQSAGTVEHTVCFSAEG